MKFTVAASLFVLALAWAVPANAGPGIVGNWRIVHVVNKGKKEAPPAAVKVTIEFAKGGKFFMRMEAKAPNGKVIKKADGGTYKIKGNKLITKVKTKEETSTYKIKGDTMTMTKPGQDAVLHLKRVK